MKTILILFGVCVIAIVLGLVMAIYNTIERNQYLKDRVIADLTLIGATENGFLIYKDSERKVLCYQKTNAYQSLSCVKE